MDTVTVTVKSVWVQCDGNWIIVFGHTFSASNGLGTTGTTDHWQVISNWRRLQGPWEGNRQGFNLKGWHRRHHWRRHSTEEAVWPCCGTSRQTSSAECKQWWLIWPRRDSTLRHRSNTGLPNSDCQKRNMLGPSSRGHNEQERIQGKHKLEHTTCTANAWWLSRLHASCKDTRPSN